MGKYYINNIYQRQKQCVGIVGILQALQRAGGSGISACTGYGEWTHKL